MDDHWLPCDSRLAPCTVDFLVPRCGVAEAERLDASASKMIHCGTAPSRDRIKDITLVSENVGMSGEYVIQLFGLFGDPALEIRS
jgi:hypothetical protein